MPTSEKNPPDLYGWLLNTLLGVTLAFIAALILVMCFQDTHPKHDKQENGTQDASPVSPEST